MQLRATHILYATHATNEQKQPSIKRSVSTALDVLVSSASDCTTSIHLSQCFERWWHNQKVYSAQLETTNQKTSKQWEIIPTRKFANQRTPSAIRSTMLVTLSKGACITCDREKTYLCRSQLLVFLCLWRCTWITITLAGTSARCRSRSSMLTSLCEMGKFKQTRLCLRWKDWLKGNISWKEKPVWNVEMLAEAPFSNVKIQKSKRYARDKPVTMPWWTWIKSACLAGWLGQSACECLAKAVVADIWPEARPGRGGAEKKKLSRIIPGGNNLTCPANEDGLQ